MGQAQDYNDDARRARRKGQDGPTSNRPEDMFALRLGVPRAINIWIWEAGRERERGRGRERSTECSGPSERTGGRENVGGVV